MHSDTHPYCGIRDTSSFNPNNCPCTAPKTNSFVGSNYYCESGINSGAFGAAVYYLSDPLWDGADCPTGNTCCDNPNLPWFYRELDMTTMDDMEVRICCDEGVLIVISKSSTTQ